MSFMTNRYWDVHIYVHKTEVNMETNSVLFVVSACIQLFIMVYGAYYFVVSVFGWSNKKTNKEPELVPANENEDTF